jgi:hypothetical protein
MYRGLGSPKKTKELGLWIKEALKKLKGNWKLLKRITQANGQRA